MSIVEAPTNQQNLLHDDGIEGGRGFISGTYAYNSSPRNHLRVFEGGYGGRVCARTGIPPSGRSRSVCRELLS